MEMKEVREVFDTPEKIYDVMADSIVELKGKPMLLDPELMREEGIDTLVYNAVFNKCEEVMLETRVIIKYLAEALGVKLSSIQPLYEAMGRGEVSGYSVPAINIRGFTYDAARAVFRTMARGKVGPVIFEIAKSEIEYTEQRPSEYTAVILAAAIKEGYKGPVFMQGDHFQINAKDYLKDKEKEVFALKDLIREAVGAGFYNIDIDASTVVDLARPTVDEQQRPNFEITAELTRLIREIEPSGVTVSVGGEIGEVGGKNSTEEELRAFMEGYNSNIGSDIKGISKISVQTGTSHGGVVLPDGSIAEVKVDFDTIERLTKVSREVYGLAGVVQHGASTLPDDSFHLFAERGASEVHLATGFQNIILDSKEFPTDITRDIKQYLKLKHSKEKKPDHTEQQFVYKTRKKAFGPFKERIWTMSRERREKISKELEDRFEMLFTSLNVKDTAEEIGKYFV